MKKNVSIILIHRAFFAYMVVHLFVLCNLIPFSILLFFFRCRSIIESKKLTTLLLYCFIEFILLISINVLSYFIILFLFTTSEQKLFRNKIVSSFPFYFFINEQDNVFRSVLDKTQLENEGKRIFQLRCELLARSF